MIFALSTNVLPVSLGIFIFGRSFNRLLDLTIESQEKAILRKDDTIILSIVDTNITWRNKQNKYIKIEGSAKEKIQLLSSDANNIILKVIDHL